MTAKLIWVTPEGDKLVGFLARVSNAKAKFGDPTSKLINSLLRDKHWSPLEMVNACVEINSTRDIIRQLLRHSFKFQEFSGRYAEYEDNPVLSEARLQDTKNRQNSIEIEDRDLQSWWYTVQLMVWDFCYFWYKLALSKGIAKELARKLLPEGIVPTKIYVNGYLRNWIHYWDARCAPETQKEHRLIAEASRKIILAEFPEIAKAIGYDVQS